MEKEAGNSAPSLLLRLGQELLVVVLRQCAGEDVARAACSCRTLAAAARRNELWHALFERDYGSGVSARTREELRRIGVKLAMPEGEDCCWRWRWRRLRRLCAMDCLGWSASSMSGQAPTSREGHAAATICDGRFVVLLGGFRPPPQDVHMFDSHAAEHENPWSGPVPMWAQVKQGGITRVEDLKDAQLAGELTRPHLLSAHPPAASLKRSSCAAYQQGYSRRFEDPTIRSDNFFLPHSLTERGDACVDLVLTPRYGMSLTTMHGVVDGVQREVLVCMGGFREGGVLAIPQTHTCTTSAHHRPTDPGAACAGYTGEASTFIVLAWDPPAAGERWPRLFFVDPAPRAHDGTRLGVQPLPCGYHRFALHPAPPCFNSPPDPCSRLPRAFPTRP
jgi:hypothetical protein